jgi:hypothetical protein
LNDVIAYNFEFFAELIKCEGADCTTGKAPPLRVEVCDGCRAASGAEDEKAA